MNESEKIYFQETQTFRQKWLWAIITLIVAISSYGFIKQIILKEAFGSKPAPDKIIIVAWIVTLLLACFLYIARLTILVKQDGLHFRFIPFNLTFRKIPFSSIKKYEARIYSPITEYGGYGIRYSRSKGKAYNVRGNCGIQFELKDDKRILFGSQRTEEFIKAIQEATNKERK